MSNTPIMSKTQFVVESGFVSDETQFTWQKDGDLDIEIYEPWQGDTVSGFGARCHITLTRGQAAALVDWLVATRP